MAIISVFGAIASIVGACVAIWQVRKAKRYRDEIKKDRKKILLFDFHSHIQEAKKECLKISTPVNKAVRGVDQQQVINTIRNCLDLIKDNVHKFENDKLSECISTIQNLIGEYIKEKEDEKRSSIADEIRLSLGEISSLISQEIDREI